MNTTAVCRAAAVTYRQLDYWARIGALVPEIPARGSGSARRYCPHDVHVARVLGALSRFGCSQLAKVGAQLQALPLERWDRLAWLSEDGALTVGGGPPDPVAVLLDLVSIAHGEREDAELEAAGAGR